MNHFRLSYVLCAFILLVRPSNSQESTVNCYSCSSYALEGNPHEDIPYNEDCWNNLAAIDTIACPSSGGCATVKYEGRISVEGYTSFSTYIERTCNLPGPNDYNISLSECITGTEFNTWHHEHLDRLGFGPDVDPWVFEGSGCACTGERCNNDISESIVTCYSCTSYALDGKPYEGLPYNEDCWNNLDAVDTITCPSSIGCATVAYNGTISNEDYSAYSILIDRTCNHPYHYNISLGECITGNAFNPWYHGALDRLGFGEDVDQWVYEGSGCACTEDKCNNADLSDWVVTCYSCTSYAQDGKPHEDIPYNEDCWNNLAAVDTITCPSSVGCATVVYNGTYAVEGYSASSIFIDRTCNHPDYYDISLSECITGTAFHPWYHDVLDKLGFGEEVDQWDYKGSGCACTGDSCNNDKFPGSGGFYVQPTVFLMVFGLFFGLYMQQN